ncbi:M23 family metallopeptidase [Aquimarina sediminis]|uniref:M23 family metallopeptidase n=1 Tax=Aquimarina sediminis TaxID=2070536 RepID=UPI001F4E3811|nr:M23 family metallopeptidase [Aquimarina sediminis]
MKSLFSTIIIITMTLCGYCQSPINSEKLKSKDTFLLKRSPTVIDSLTLDNVIDIKADYWNTAVFNPYRNKKIEFPIRLKFSDSSYSSPITRNKVITSRFGWRNGRGHHGIDIDLITGDSIFSMFDGIVRFAKYSTGHGKTIVIRHYNGLETVYAHLSKYAVKANDTIKQGQYIGHGGASGNARGSHLHLGIYHQGIAIYPEYLFEFGKNNNIRAKEIWITKKWTLAYLHNSKKQSVLNLFATKKEAQVAHKREKKIYTVKRGDTLSRIALRNNTSITSICKTNYIKSSSVLKIGQKLIIK